MGCLSPDHGVMHGGVVEEEGTSGGGGGQGEQGETSEGLDQVLELQLRFDLSP